MSPRNPLVPYSCCFCFDSYLWSFRVHTWTSSEKKDPVWKSSLPHVAHVSHLVADLAKRAAPDRPGTVFVMDSYFTRVSTLNELLRCGYEGIGTVKARCGVPDRILWSKKDNRRRPVGLANFYRSTWTGFLLQQWQDRGKVSVLSSVGSGVRGYPRDYQTLPGVESVSRRRKAGQAWSLCTVPCPPVVRMYQKFMGGDDLAAQVTCPLIVASFPLFEFFAPCHVFCSGVVFRRG